MMQPQIQQWMGCWVIFTVAPSNEHVQPLYKKGDFYAKNILFITCRSTYIFHTHVHIYIQMFSDRIK
jgi:hypothetical protein